MELIDHEIVIHQFRLRPDSLALERVLLHPLLGVILVTEADRGLIEDILSNMSDLHYATGRHILLVISIPPATYNGKAVRKTSLRHDQLNGHISKVLTPAAYRTLEAFGLSRTVR